MDQPARMPLGIIVERQDTGNVWQPQRWAVIAALPGNPVAEPWTVLARRPGRTRYFAGTVTLALYRGETGNYKQNLESARPSVFVILRRTDTEPGLRLLEATVDPGEADAHADAGDDLIEALPLPPAVAVWMTDFITRYHRERDFYKRRRSRADPEALAHGRGWRSDNHD